MYSTHNEKKSVLPERFIRNLKNKIYKYMTSKSKKYNNTYNSTIKLKHVNVKSSTYIDFNVEKNDKNPKLNFHDHVRISKYKSIFAKDYTRNRSEEVFLILI